MQTGGLFMEPTASQLEKTVSYYQDQPYSTQAKRTYDILIELIAQGVLSGARTYTEAELSSILQVGRTPLREALKLLEFDAVIKTIPRLGIQVQECRIEEYLLQVEVRVALENVVIRRACSLVTDDVRQRLQALNDRFAEIAKTDDSLELYRVDRKLHAAIDECSKNPYAVHALAPLRFYEQRVHYLLSRVYPETGLHLNMAHIAFVQAIVGGREEDACKFFGEMISSTTKLVQMRVGANMGMSF